MAQRFVAVFRANHLEASRRQQSSVAVRGGLVIFSEEHDGRGIAPVARGLARHQVRLAIEDQSSRAAGA
jgi:hypothetical protein